MEKKYKQPIIAIIPARAGSKRLLNKNIKVFAGKPLLCWSIYAALLSKKINIVCISTEDENIKEITIDYVESCGDINKMCFMIDRPDHLASDDASVIDVIRDASKTLQECLIYKEIFETSKEMVEADPLFVLLYPTYPLRTPKLVDDVIGKNLKVGYGSYVTMVYGDKKVFWHMKFSGDDDKIEKVIPNEYFRLQDMPDVFRHAGAVLTVFNSDLIDMDKNGISPNLFGHLIHDDLVCLEVDDSDSFNLAERTFIEMGYEEKYYSHNG